jgi:glycosyltransferase involved in cell wall biosynthesis
MRIGLDARLASRGLGIGTFVVELARRLVDDVELVWFGAPELAPPGTADVVDLSSHPFPYLDSPLGRARAAKAKVDVFHFPGNSGWTRPGPMPVVLTIQDLIFMDTPVRGRHLRQILGHRYLRTRVGRSARAATVVCCPSETTADDVVARLGVGRRPAVIPIGIDFPELPPAEAGDYALAFSARDPRKGVELAFEAWRAAGRHPRRLRLLAGAGLPEGFEATAAAEIAAGEVEIAGYLPREELWATLAGAAVLIHTSSAEGYGLPVLEAMAAGVPVISGLAPAACEVGGDAILALDPADPVRSAAGWLRRLRDEPGLARATRERGLARAAELGTARTAAEYRHAYEQALGERA